MTISFDAIWLPIAVSALGLGWASLMLRNFGESGLGILEEIAIGALLPAVPVLGAWLIWALLT